MQNLPQEVLVQVFQLLDYRNKCILVRVSHHIKNVLYNNPHCWIRLVLANELSLGGEKQVDSTSSSGRKLINNAQPVLDLGANQQLFRIFDTPTSIARFSSLKKLELSYTNIDLEVFNSTTLRDAFGNTLTHLYLDGCLNVDNYSLYSLKNLQALTHLDISHCSAVDDNGIHVLAFILPRIQSLNLSYLFKLTDRGVQRLFRLPELVTVNLLGCYRIRSYYWAFTSPDKTIYPIKELLLGEDSRIQTGGFWLLWCCWSWNMATLATSCPFLETLRINMVLFDLDAGGVTCLLQNCRALKHLGLVVDRNIVQSLCDNAARLETLETLELTCHIGLSNDNMSQLIQSKCLRKLTALKFHSKHTLVFDDSNLMKFSKLGMPIEYFEINAENIGEEAICSLAGIGATANHIPIVREKRDSKCEMDDPPTILPKRKACTPKQSTKVLQNLLIHNATFSNSTLTTLSKYLTNAREITLSNLHQAAPQTKLSKLVIGNGHFEKNLKKLELSSISGFSDKDLALIPASCTQLQWIEFTFSFTFVRTLKALEGCKNLLYLKLHRQVPITPDRASQKMLASSPECKSLISFSKKCARSLRMLELGGNIGISDYTLESMATGMSMSTSLHTLFLEGIDLGTLSSKGVIKFAEIRRKWLKRLNLRNCCGVVFDCVQEDFLMDCGVEVVVDGLRLGLSRSSRIESIVV